MRRTTRLSGGTAGVLVMLALSGCGGSTAPAVTVEQKRAADARASQTAAAGQQAQFLPLLRKYHDQVTWPQGRDMSPDQMWKDIAPTAGQLVLDDNVAQSQVGFVNLCAWAMTAIDTVKASKDTADVRRGLLQSSKLMPGGESFSQGMADELVLGNVEKAQQFVTANHCDKDSS